MDAFAVETFTAAVRPVAIDIYTGAYRISGIVQTRFTRVAEIVNQQSSTHVVVEQATVSEHADPLATVSAPRALVAIDEILLFVAPGVDGAPRPDMRIPKRPVRALLAVPPLRITGTAHVPQGSRPADGLLNVGERFVPLTDATVESGAFPQLARTATALAVRRDRAHLVLVADDEHPEQLLAEVLDQRTAEAWLREAEEAG